MDFKKMHNTHTPLIICNVWDVKSAQLAQENGFEAIGTSSAAIATMLGYKDGEKMSFEELFYIVRRIRECTNISLTVDMEAGYSRDVKKIIAHCRMLIDIGVSGINIEDSIVYEKRELREAEKFAGELFMIAEEISKELFINVRTDTYLLRAENPLKESLRRISLYEAAGASGVFIPCVTDNYEILRICRATKLPVNVMCMPDLTDFDTLRSLGVRRISMGNFVFDIVQTGLKKQFKAILNQGNFKGVFV